jgi:uncharacterized membrane protein
MKQQIKQILIRSTGLVLATFFGGTAVGAVVGSWWMGSLIGVGSAFAVVLTMIGVSITWSGELSDQSITNAFRAAVAKAAEDNEAIKKALDVEEDGEFSFDDLVDDNDLEEYNK